MSNPFPPSGSVSPMGSVSPSGWVAPPDFCSFMERELDTIRPKKRNYPTVSGFWISIYLIIMYLLIVEVIFR